MSHRWRRVAALAAAALTLAACSGSDNGGAVGGVAPVHSAPAAPGALRGQVPAAIAARGVLRVGAAVGRAPLMFYGTGTHQLEGLEYDLLQDVGVQLGLRVEVVDEPLDQLGPQMLAHHTDAFMSGFVDLKSFQGTGIDFVDYLTGRTAVLVRHADPNRASGPDGLCGKKVGLLGGTAQQVASTALNDACKGRGRPALALRIDADHGALLQSLARGQLDAVLDDATVAQYNAQESTGAATLDVAGATIDPLPYGIGVPKDDPQLRDVLQAAMQAIVADGTYDAALAHWGGDDAALHTITVNAGP